jgi:hypothetical protein
MGQVIIARLRKTAIEQLGLAVLSPLRRHLRHQAFHFHPVRAGVCGFLQREAAKNLFVKNKFAATMRCYATLSRQRYGPAAEW